MIIIIGYKKKPLDCIQKYYSEKCGQHPVIAPLRFGLRHIWFFVDTHLRQTSFIEGMLCSFGIKSFVILNWLFFNKPKCWEKFNWNQIFMKLLFYLHTLMDRMLNRKLQKNIIWNVLTYKIVLLLNW